MTKYILLAIWLFSFAASAQEKLEIIDLDEINNSISLKSQQGDYEGVLELLNKINKNDTTYAASLIRKSYHLLALKRHDNVIAVLDEGISMDIGDIKSSFYQNKGVSFTQQEKFDEAIAVLNEGLEIFPANPQILFNKAVALQGKGELREAVQILEQVITLSPFYARAYIQLGAIYNSQERSAQALMAYDLALLMDPDGEASFERLKAINNIFSSKNENKRTPGLVLSKDDEAFNDIDLIISNRIALNKEYKTGNAIDIPLTNQNHALLATLADFKGNGGFWSKKVVPFYQWIQDSKNFDAFTYTISYSIENEKYKKIVTKKTKEVENFLKEAIVNWINKTKADNKSLFSDKVIQYAYDGNSLVISGMGTEEAGIPVGEWIYFNQSGRIMAQGQYNKDGERTGNWKWYNENLKLKETANYKEGDLDGENHIYYPNGQLSLKGFYKKGELDGEFLYYNEKGALKQKKYFKNGELDGIYTSYFNVGEKIPEFIIPYKKGKIEKEAMEYYANGKVYSKSPVKDGKKHGTEKIFYANDKLSNEFTYVDGKLEGPFKSYYRNGEIYEMGTYKQDLFQGPYTIYYSDGTLQSEANYLDGFRDGSFTYYDYDGKKHYNYRYKKGDILDYRFYNKKGEIIKEGKRRGGEFYYNSFSPYGTLISEGLYDVSGGQKGEWKFYSPNGNLTSKGTFDKNLGQGTHISYYSDGTKEWEGNYRNDTLVGYSASYYKNGKINNQGGYKNGMKQGEWRFYYIDGSLKSINFFHKDKFHGEQEYFGVDGKLINTAQYKNDDVIYESFYDRSGNSHYQIEYKPSKKDTILVSKHYNGKENTTISYLHGIKHGEYKSYFFSGKLEAEGQYLDGSLHGAWTWYFENGKPRMKATYVLGKLDGEFTTYFKNGQIDDSTFYDSGDLMGTWKSYYEDGTLYTKTSYLSGEAHGRKEFFSPTGQLQLVRFYNHGTLIGYSYNDTNGDELPMIPIINETAKIIAYYDNGKISREFEYKNGETVGTYKTYYYNGQLKDEFVNVNGEYEGPKISYYANGNIEERLEYLMGELHGKSTKYYDNGTIKEETNYKNGIQTGNASSYDKTGKKTRSEDYFNGKIYAQQIF
ncbi:hypothetical protein EI546_06900 [Aequorivita sp. H23M31]|uniref:Uncharacterized protein n=1 Tax=Aequorivita ciconiae TaxID=2494375 RepID=A0A410G2K2_9FLAO|nr:toxin-antitoxin system YwqK family antitoxin [Aequorivita sp. H23M31]QAA81471.1 hypothetical protein EI546_06900 [Aequorivita sp. H23M31]